MYDAHPSIPGYCFECVPTPLASGGVGLFLDESLNYTVLEKISIEAFQALWVKMSFVKDKNMCGIIYHKHNSPEYFQSYFEDTIERLALVNKVLYVALRCENYS